MGNFLDSHTIKGEFAIITAAPKATAAPPRINFQRFMSTAAREGDREATEITTRALHIACR